MTIGVMQPYLFPYIGYFQLIHAVDKFILYDDVNFIKQGWINRNRIVLNSNISYFSVPLQNQSSNQKINQTQVSERHYELWKNKFLKSLKYNYSLAPNFAVTFQLIEHIMNSPHVFISELVAQSIQEICAYINISTDMIASSSVYNNTHLTGQDRIIELCKIESAKKYVNLPGGINLYDKKQFNLAGIDLKFLIPNEISYRQGNNTYIPNLSIIDLLMYNSKIEMQEIIKQYKTI